METCYYKTVGTTADTEDDDKGPSRKYLVRQMFVCSGLWASYFTFGLSFGSPTVFIPQIRKEANSSEAISIEMESWLSSALNYSGMLSTILMAILARLIGRKFSFVIICVTSIVGYILLYYSTTVTHILIGEIIHGPLTASPMTISIMVLTEYVSPRYRGVFLTLKSAVFIWGIWVANAIGTFFHWKNIMILGFLCCIYSTSTLLLWPESPYWLATKNRMKDCAASHRWLKGWSKESTAELETLIQSRKIMQPAQVTTVKFHKKVVKMLSSISFYKPVLMSFAVLSLYHFSGKIACGMYAIEIIKRITGKTSTAYTGMLILDGITVVGMYVGCGLSKILTRRTLLLLSSAIGVTFLFCISFYLYLISFEIIVENTIVSMTLLIGYSLTISIGPMIMSTTILGELIPVKYRSSAVLFIGCAANLLMGSVLKISPFILKYFEARGLFLFFSVSALLFTIINYKFLPETKDKTILEIQEELLGEKPNKKSVDCLEDQD